jgi:O-antigen/teichoic acid export membrane protein
MTTRHLLKNISVLSTGVLFSQVILILSYPFLATLYSPDDFGVLGVVLAAAGLVTPWAALRFEAAIVLERTQDGADSTYAAGILSASSISVVLLILVGIMHIGGWMIPNSEHYMWVPIFVFALALNNIVIYRLNSNTLYKIIAFSHMSRRIFITVFQVLFYFIMLNHLGLIAGHLVGLLLTVVLCMCMTDTLLLKSKQQISDMQNAYTRHRKLVIFGVPQSILNSGVAQSPVLITSFFYDTAAVGALFLAIKLIQLPVAALSQPVRATFFKFGADNSADITTLYSVFLRFSYIPLLIVMCCFSVSFALIPPLIATFLGEEWSQVADFGPWLVLWMGLNLAHQPARALFTIFDRQDQLLFWEVASGLIRLSFLVGASFQLEAVQSVAIFSIASAMLFFGLILFWHLQLKSMNS